MALDTILGSLTTIEQGKKVASPKYRPENLTDTATGLDKLEKFDLTTTAGIRDYASFTGDNPSEHSTRMLDNRRDARLNGGQEDLSLYVDKHFYSVTKEVKEPDQINIGYKSCPTEKIEGGNRKYNEVIEVVETSKKTRETIANTPETFIAETIKNESKVMGSYIVRFADHFLRIEDEEAQERASLALFHYGAGEFITTTRNYFKEHADALSTAKESLEEKIKLRIDMAKKNNKGKILSAIKTADILSGLTQEMKDLHEKHAAAANLTPLTQDVATYAIRTIAERAAA